MKASELRIGNWINWINRPVQIKNAVELYNISTDEVNAKPIPLSEEWLLKFGFKEDEPHLFLNVDTFLQITYDQYKKRLSLFLYGKHYFPKEIKYVHQLQNLYHSLTGEELTIKQ